MNKLEILNLWADRVTQADKAIDDAHASIGKMLGMAFSSDGDLTKAIYDLMGAYTTLVAVSIGDDGGNTMRFHDSWLSWYRFECQMGARPVTVKMPDGTVITCASTADLLRIIDWGKGHAS